ncbi:MAG: hypothetical protein ABH858_02005, partial [Candidatus Omnitrophota bacterium]
EELQALESDVARAREGFLTEVIGRQRSKLTERIMAALNQQEIKKGQGVDNLPFTFRAESPGTRMYWLEELSPEELTSFSEVMERRESMREVPSSKDSNVSASPLSPQSGIAGRGDYLDDIRTMIAGETGVNGDGKGVGKKGAAGITPFGASSFAGSSPIEDEAVVEPFRKPEALPVRPMNGIPLPNPMNMTPMGISGSPLIFGKALQNGVRMAGELVCPSALAMGEAADVNGAYTDDLQEQFASSGVHAGPIFKGDRRMSSSAVAQSVQEGKKERAIFEVYARNGLKVSSSLTKIGENAYASGESAGSSSARRASGRIEDGVSSGRGASSKGGLRSAEKNSLSAEDRQPGDSTANNIGIVSLGLTANQPVSFKRHGSVKRSAIEPARVSSDSNQVDGLAGNRNSAFVFIINFIPKSEPSGKSEGSAPQLPFIHRDSFGNREGAPSNGAGSASDRNRASLPVSPEDGQNSRLGADSQPGIFVSNNLVLPRRGIGRGVSESGCIRPDSAAKYRADGLSPPLLIDTQKSTASCPEYSRRIKPGMNASRLSPREFGEIFKRKLPRYIATRGKFRKPRALARGVDSLKGRI